ncbi:hypothetical protein A4E84_02385 [Streptomyces qaidamensis]|uniref:Uncharacterized protein n=1 Tax=Streptomyces qaidamensis TaxID=1783515 RepID=A0A143BTK9_9ACTN|nr:hypothetical protein A4E84_02385 [Streptomyces qaidamensis]
MALTRWASSAVGRNPASSSGSTSRRTSTSLSEVTCGLRTTETLTRIACSLPGGTPGRSVSIAA